MDSYLDNNTNRFLSSSILKIYKDLAEAFITEKLNDTPIVHSVDFGEYDLEPEVTTENEENYELKMYFPFFFKTFNPIY